MCVCVSGGGALSAKLVWWIAYIRSWLKSCLMSLTHKMHLWKGDILDVALIANETIDLIDKSSDCEVFMYVRHSEGI